MKTQLLPPFLKAALNFPEANSDPLVRTLLLSDLVRWKDTSVLPLAEDDLFLPLEQTAQPAKLDLLNAISTLGPQVLVPLLSLGHSSHRSRSSSI